MTISKLHAALVAAIAGSMALWHMWVVWAGPPEALIYRGIHLGFALALIYLTYGLEPARGGLIGRLWSALMLVLGLGAIAYLFVNYAYVVNRILYIDPLEGWDWLWGAALTLVVLDATRRVIGWALPLTAIGFLFYAIVIHGQAVELIIDQTFLTTEGIFSSTLGVSAAYVMIFVVFGAFMERTGTGQLFMDFALSLTGHTAGGPGKVSVVSSSLFGTISGSAVANVMVDGPITIPLMKRSGFRPAFSAGVESVASTGGQIMPPIMGAAAFVMAEFLAVPYIQVVLWALIPAVLYYGACFAAVHFEAKRMGLLGVPREELPRLSEVLATRGHLFLPVLFILTMMSFGYSAPLAALIGTLACFPVALLRAGTRRGLAWLLVWEALVDGARNTLPVALACACAGIVIGTIALTGLGIDFTALIVTLAQNSLLGALLLTMVAGIILGMGMPTTPAYIVMVSLLVPALIKLGVVEPAAHMFAFYFAILSAITPPVALAVYAAAGLAKSDLWESGLAAVKIGAAGFIVPFMFVYEPSLLMIGEWSRILHVTITASIGVVALAGGLHGYFLRRATRWERAALIGAALTLVEPGLWTDMLGAGLLALVMAVQWADRTRATAAAQPR
ncbi:MAG: TRAP transporter permease [Thalassobaculales bacterium]